MSVDEIWSYVGKKQRQVTPEDDGSRVGDQWTIVALDPETKIVPAFRIGKRDLRTATVFMTDLSERLSNRVQISSDALAAYVGATERAFGADVDYGQVVEFYDAEPAGAGRYSPPHVVHAESILLRSFWPTIRLIPGEKSIQSVSLKALKFFTRIRFTCIDFIPLEKHINLLSKVSNILR